MPIADPRRSSRIVGWAAAVDDVAGDRDVLLGEIARLSETGMLAVFLRKAGEFVLRAGMAAASGA